MTTVLAELLANAMLAMLANPHLKASADEVKRELEVRQRCYPRWVKEGKLSETDADDRLMRLAQAEKTLRMLRDAYEWVAEDGSTVKGELAGCVPTVVPSTGDKETAGQESARPF